MMVIIFRMMDAFNANSNANKSAVFVRKVNVCNVILWVGN